MNAIEKSSHLTYLSQALEQAQKSPPKPSNFRVGCVIVSFQNPSAPVVLSTGYTLELPGNTHAEQCALQKFAQSHSLPEAALFKILTPATNAVLYSTLEPCGKRLSGNTPCVQRIIATRRGNPTGGIRKVIFGAKEPGTFVQDSQSCRLFTEAGVEWEYVPGLDEEILHTAMEGHSSKATEAVAGSHQQASIEEPPAQQDFKHPSQGTNIDDISTEEKRRQDEQPRNPKKRMMEV